MRRRRKAEPERLPEELLPRNWRQWLTDEQEEAYREMSDMKLLMASCQLEPDPLERQRAAAEAYGCGPEYREHQFRFAKAAAAGRPDDPEPPIESYYT